MCNHFPVQILDVRSIGERNLSENLGIILIDSHNLAWHFIRFVFYPFNTFSLINKFFLVVWKVTMKKLLKLHWKFETSSKILKME